jgi:hypothetical protein
VCKRLILLLSVPENKQKKGKKTKKKHAHFGDFDHALRAGELAQIQPLNGRLGGLAPLAHRRAVVPVRRARRVDGVQGRARAAAAAAGVVVVSSHCGRGCDLSPADGFFVVDVVRRQQGGGPEGADVPVQVEGVDKGGQAFGEDVARDGRTVETFGWMDWLGRDGKRERRGGKK